MVHLQGRSRRVQSLSRYRLTVLQETKQLTLEEIDLLFGDRALGLLPDNLDDAEKQIEMEKIENARKKLAGTNVVAVH
jgi:hypothetical protein